MVPSTIVYSEQCRTFERQRTRSRLFYAFESVTVDHDLMRTLSFLGTYRAISRSISGVFMWHNIFVIESCHREAINLSKLGQNRLITLTCLILVLSDVGLLETVVHRRERLNRIKLFKIDQCA